MAIPTTRIPAGCRRQWDDGVDSVSLALGGLLAFKNG